MTPQQEKDLLDLIIHAFDEWSEEDDSVGYFNEEQNKPVFTKYDILAFGSFLLKNKKYTRKSLFLHR